ncbi:hypothetical protein D3C71_1921040 [compost metagenome]
MQGGIECGGGLVAHVPYAPLTTLGGNMHGVEHTTHVRQRVGHQHLMGGAKGVAQARCASVQRLCEVDA